MPYLPNLAAVGEFYEKSVESLTTELTRCNQLGITYIVTHLGSNQGQGYTSGLNQITKAVNKALSDAPTGAMILLENTAGTIHSMGSSFEELKRILDGVSDPQRVGVCFDTCHAYAAGYDLGNTAAVNSVFSRFNQVIGLEQLKVIHLNDSKEGFRSKVDRHTRIGEGYIGEAGFRALLSHPKVRKTPLILETPLETREEEIQELNKVRRLAEEAE
jgi:deoxyribonuclease IV